MTLQRTSYKATGPGLKEKYLFWMFGEFSINKLPLPENKSFNVSGEKDSPSPPRIQPHGSSELCDVQMTIVELVSHLCLESIFLQYPNL